MPAIVVLEGHSGNSEDAFLFEAARSIQVLAQQQGRPLEKLTGEEDWFESEIRRLNRKYLIQLDVDQILIKLKKITGP